MIQSKYKIAFSIKVLHTYFENDVCSCLQFSPDTSTGNIINRFGFKVMPNINGFDLYANLTNPLSETLHYIAHTTGLSYFDFKIATTDSAFVAFTDLPSDWSGQLLFDSQSVLNKYKDGRVMLVQDLSPEQDVSCIGSLKIHFDDILVCQTKSGEVLFQLNFVARSTQWNYYVINKSLILLNNPSITGKVPVEFEGPENVTIQSGQAALLFSSGSNLIPLSEVPKYIFDLVNNPALKSAPGSTKKQAGKIVFKGLPNPSPTQIGMIKINDKNQISSPMYVYV